MAFYTYLNFGGNCREAFTRYREIFGGELSMMAMSDMPAEANVPPEQADLIMHTALRVDGALLMGSDDPSPDFAPMQGAYVNYSATDADDAEQKFAALADGGKVVMPIGETFWSPRFGICTDRFGVQWMVDTPPADQQG